VKDHGHTHKFYLNYCTTFFDWAFEYGGGSKFLGYDGTNAEPFCIELLKFVTWA
jgi:hypothetical protein